MALYSALLHEGVYAMAIRPPTVAPGTCRLRFTLCAAHDVAMVNRVIAGMDVALRKGS
jgi:8-amino-7-oxononanoate synthase